MPTITTTNLNETKALAAEIVGLLKPAERATVLALYGDLGAGKTSFTQGLAASLGVVENISSPTFVIEKIYDLPVGQSFKKLIHIDAYRLSEGGDLAKLGFETIESESENLIVIEWPEQVADIIPVGAKKISFKFIDDNMREITYEI